MTIYDDIDNTYIDFYDFIVKNYNKLYKHNRQKHDIKEILRISLIVLKTGIAWRDIKFLSTKIPWNTIYYNTQKLIKNGIIKHYYDTLVQKCIKIEDISYLITDTTVIQNKNNSDICEYNNLYFKNKKCCKISVISTENNTPIDIKIYKGNEHDSPILCDQLNDECIKRIKQTIKLNKNKKIVFLADTGYDSSKIKTILSKKIKIKHLIPQNKRNIKDKNKIIVFNDEDTITYKNRVKIEYSFKLLKNYKKINLIYDKQCNIFYNFVLLFYICNMTKFLNKHNKK